jgi:hypothetical protein
MRTRTPRLPEGGRWPAISQKPERLNRLPAKLTALGRAHPGSEFQMVRTHGGDSPQDVKRFMLKRGTTHLQNSDLRTNKIKDLPHANPRQL